MKRIVYHVDVNSAYLSWEAAFRLLQGDALDLRTIPSAVGGDPLTRRGIILAKSIPAGRYGVRTGESLMEALKKCPSLHIVRPHFSLYRRCSAALKEELESWSPHVETFSIDESFMDMSHAADPILTAHQLKDNISKKLGFTVNIGVSSNKLLAKMASDFQKPDRVHSLFPEEIPKKMWPLPVRKLFMVGARSEQKLHSMGIHTIGEIAEADPQFLYRRMKSHGILLSNYARGIESSDLRHYSPFDAKGIGNSTTLPRDIDQLSDLRLYLLAISEMVSSRLRAIGRLASVIHVHYRSSLFHRQGHQRKLLSGIDQTMHIFECACELFEEIWKKEPVRQIGIRLSDFSDSNCFQPEIFRPQRTEAERRLDRTIDELRERFGDDAISRASFLHTSIPHIIGGVGEERYDLTLRSQL